MSSGLESRLAALVARARRDHAVFSAIGAVFALALLGGSAALVYWGLGFWIASGGIRVSLVGFLLAAFVAAAWRQTAQESHFRTNEEESEYPVVEEELELFHLLLTFVLLPVTVIREMLRGGILSADEGVQKIASAIVGSGRERVDFASVRSYFEEDSDSAHQAVALLVHLRLITIHGIGERTEYVLTSRGLQLVRRAR